MSDDELLFAEEDPSDNVGEGIGRAPWVILVVDDDTEVHALSRLLLSEIEFKGRRVAMYSAYSAAEARAMLGRIDDVAVILLDVVMETDDAGLKLVRTIRETMNNRDVRIILRTGQPGQAPEREVIETYDINDYKSKTELTAQKLHTALVAALRAYDDIMALVLSRQGLRKILDAAASLYRQRSMELFAAGVLTQINALLGGDRDGILCVQSRKEQADEDDPAGAMVVLAASGAYERLVGKRVDELPESPVISLIREAAASRTSRHGSHASALYMPTGDGRETVVFLHAAEPLKAQDRALMQLFCDNISAGFDTVCEIDDLRRENVRLRARLGEAKAP
ncbi:DUF3369 domain-containing protein [Rhodospirillum rubrum]|uniref:Response regulatory domain-containing protein n=1 Tax=Rhodospirillum rubrum (strain ATCC 11170 / ATH 1.1.1 / DSM 467 / LMG 4362 / NCIMB 8255 / S1) TaxID=269796 RepID=Q2RY59_RHORT|nr:DUF3369 domain-containing protein [Rhodospirillum rubrum]ABC20936.1 Response regulator receiver (CheY) and unknown domain protein [Rhodospirillum rubrum ATCC 11170]AEO46603.1 response regulator receiver (CheY) and unknown domain-containing protein [Rhodospirillum rubrum F11]MBK5952494.1 hypothetical protein [Rhodospirillum rubrum]QXG80635.1 DUF3369 domain-containing protein [Rhodospirillum rubrum]